MVRELVGMAARHLLAGNWFHRADLERFCSQGPSLFGVVITYSLELLLGLWMAANGLGTMR
jgi:hypothetical protein